MTNRRRAGLRHRLAAVVVVGAGCGHLGEVCLGPLGQGAEEGRQGQAQGADLVLHAGRHLRVVGADDQAVAFHLAQALGQHLRGDRADPALQLHEALASVLVEQPQDRGRPAAEHQVHHRADRARLGRDLGGGPGGGGGGAGHGLGLQGGWDGAGVVTIS
ncbi:hypothetical protein SBRY_40606 [Actinacidiphila bryophytorum]|uniref:Uncharacterized protein n=1 Tax=Actinacidiphila bryophytorum TaxID=1436133 RepID=A0A9W4MBV5_9ACTN|nr:hypothetical protein SBRY_40606 [Actinacidiphila bryophytorum]